MQQDYSKKRKIKLAMSLKRDSSCKQTFPVSAKNQCFHWWNNASASRCFHGIKTHKTLPANVLASILAIYSPGGADMWMDLRFDRIPCNNCGDTRFGDHESGYCGRCCRFPPFCVVCHTRLFSNLCVTGIRIDSSRLPKTKSGL